MMSPRDTCLYDGKKLEPAFRDFGFCNSVEKGLYDEEAAYEKQRAIDAFKKEGEPNRGKRGIQDRH